MQKCDVAMRVTVANLSPLCLLNQHRGFNERLAPRGRAFSFWSKAHGLVFNSFYLFICYHAATRTGQLSPICTHFDVSLVCCFLWG